jgi:membrane protein implicated in regulation of membrane protease activity
MKNFFTILAIIASVFAIIFSVLPISNLAIIPAGAALIFGLIAFYLSKKTGEVKKIIQFSFLLTIAALAIITYKSVFTTTEIASTEIIEAKEIESEEEAIEELEDLSIEDLEIDDADLEFDETELEFDETELEVNTEDLEIDDTDMEILEDDIEIEETDLEDIEL